MRLLWVFIVALVISNASAQGEDVLERLQEAEKKLAERHKCPSPKCFRRLQACCWIYRPCGTVGVFAFKRNRCKLNICGKLKKRLCRAKCRKVAKKLKREKCGMKLKKVGKVCGKVWSTVNGKRVCKEVCKPKWGKKKECIMEDYLAQVKECAKQCAEEQFKKCKEQNWWCLKYEKVKYTKYCPTLRCDQAGSIGDDKKPDDLPKDKESKKEKKKYEEMIERLTKDRKKVEATLRKELAEKLEKLEEEELKKIARVFVVVRASGVRRGRGRLGRAQLVRASGVRRGRGHLGRARFA